MPEFALIFRPGNKTLAADEQARRAAAVRAWVTDASQKGTLDHPHLLEETGVAIASDRSSSTTLPEGTPSTVLIVRASDLPAAVAVAKSHPGLDFGASVEVRALKPTVIPLANR